MGLSDLREMEKRRGCERMGLANRSNMSGGQFDVGVMSEMVNGAITAKSS